MDLDIELLTMPINSGTQYVILDITQNADNAPVPFLSKDIVLLTANGVLGIGAVPLFQAIGVPIDQKQFVAQVTPAWTTTGAVAEILIQVSYYPQYGNAVQKNFEYVLPLATNTYVPQ